MENRKKRYSVPFAGAYFMYYGAYVLFSSFMVSYLTARGLTATACGVVTSFTLLANVSMQPVSGYITDTWLSVRKYLILSAGILMALCLAGRFLQENMPVCMILIVIAAGFGYPFSQLMDAWATDVTARFDPELVYSRVRAGGSIGFAAASAVLGRYFAARGYGDFFLLQIVFFAAAVPFILMLPDPGLGNAVKKQSRSAEAGEGGTCGQPAEEHLSMPEAFAALLHNGRYMLCIVTFGLYWMSHRPVGSYLALIIQSFGGADDLFGSVCAVGAAAEFVTLMLTKNLRKHISVRQTCLLTFLFNLVRPALLFFFPGEFSLYAGQIIQSFSFAFFLAVSVELFSDCADRRIHNFSVSVGVSVTTVAGMLCANLIGGRLYDLFGAAGNTGMSLGLALAVLGLFLATGRKLTGRENA